MTWVYRLLLGMILMVASGCEATKGTLLAITVTGVVPDVRTLRVTVTVAGARTRFEVLPDPRYFGIRIPTQYGGDLALEIAGLQQDHCFQSRGRAQATLTGQARIDLQVALSDLSERLCPIVINKVGDGTGQVISQPGYLDCGAVCEADVPSSPPLQLQTDRNSASRRASFVAGCQDLEPAGEIARCQVTVDRPVSITAQFLENRLQIAGAGPGLGRVTSEPAGIDCGATCSGIFPIGALVTLQATPLPGQGLWGWDGPCQPSGEPTCRITVQTSMTVKARFAPPPVLSALTFSNGSLSPAFAPETTLYTLRVPAWLSAISVSPVAEDGAYPVIDAGRSAGTVPLMSAMTTLSVAATTSGGATRSYTILVIRGEQGAPPSRYLKASNTDARGSLRLERLGRTRGEQRPLRALLRALADQSRRPDRRSDGRRAERLGGTAAKHGDGSLPDRPFGGDVRRLADLLAHVARSRARPSSPQCGRRAEFARGDRRSVFLAHKAELGCFRSAGGSAAAHPAARRPWRL